MARLSPPERLDAIVEATVRVLLRRGLAATTVRDVADEMGSSSGLIHHYFASMDDLLAAGFERAASRDLLSTRQAMDGCGDAVDRLRTFFATYTRAEQDWAFQLWLDAWAEASRRPAVQATSERLNVAWQQLLVETVRDGVVANEMVCADPEGASWRILSLLDGLALQTVAHRHAVDRRAVVSWSAAYAETELGLPPGALLSLGTQRKAHDPREVSLGERT